MKKNLTLLLLIPGFYAMAQKIPVVSQTNIDSIFNNYERPNVPGVAVLVVKDGKVVFEKGYGSANLAYDIHVSPTTVFDIASVSKQFTGFAISALIQQGKISSEDDVHKYLPDVPDFGKKIIIRNLIHHTSGLRDWPEGLHTAGWRWDESFSYDDIMRMVSKQKELDFEPGSTYQYSNTGYNLLAAIVAKVTGTTFPEWVKQNIFIPLQMNSSQVLSDYSRVVKNHAMAYNYYGDEYHQANDALTAFGSSSIHTTAEDLAKWVIHFQKKLDEKDPVFLRMIETDVLNDNKPNNYAYGLIIGENGGLRNVSHDGGWAGYSTIISNYPDQKLSIILLSNDSGFDPWRYANLLAQLFLKGTIKPQKQWENLSNMPTITRDTNLLKKYVGTYHLGPGWYVTFTLENGKMIAQATNEGKFSTELKSDTVLWVPGYGSSVTFIQISDKANAIRYHGNIAERITPIKVNVADLNQYIGSYYSKELETTYKVTVEKGKVTAHHMRLGDIELLPDMATPGHFSSGIGAIKFYKNDEGGIAGFQVSGGRVRNIRFEKQR